MEWWEGLNLGLDEMGGLGQCRSVDGWVGDEEVERCEEGGLLSQVSEVR